MGAPSVLPRRLLRGRGGAVRVAAAASVALLLAFAATLALHTSLAAGGRGHRRADKASAAAARGGVVLREPPDAPAAPPTADGGCAWSMRESLGLLCDDDTEWALRRAGAAWQAARNAVEAEDANFRVHMGVWWQNNYEPEFSCAHERRLGRQGDGGKWLCDPHRVAERAERAERAARAASAAGAAGNEAGADPPAPRCVVYSFGSNNDFSFEEAMVAALPACEVHTFDHTIGTPDATKVPSGVTFHAWGLAAADLPGDVDSAGRTMLTLPVIMHRLRHDDPRAASLEILKVDVEGAEWSVFLPMLEARSLPFARQLLIELHPTSLSDTRSFFRLMHGAGYRIAHKEPNTYQAGVITEFTFLLLNMAPDVPEEKLLLPATQVQAVGPTAAPPPPPIVNVTP